MRRRVLIAGSVIVLLTACGSGEGSGTRPTLPADVSIGLPTSPAAGAGTSPAATQPPEQLPVETAPPVASASPEEGPDGTGVSETTPASGVADDDDSDGTVWWPWILGALVVIGVIGAIAAMTRRRRLDPSWQIRSTTLLDEVEQLTSHLAVVTPAGLHAVAQSDAAKLATLRARLAELVASAPDAHSGTALNGLTASLAALHGAVDAIAMSAGPSMQPDVVSVAQIAAQLHTASATARAELAIPH